MDVEVESAGNGGSDEGLFKEKLRLMLLSVDGWMVDLGLLDAEREAFGATVLYGG